MAWQRGAGAWEKMAAMVLVVAVVAGLLMVGPGHRVRAQEEAGAPSLALPARVTVVGDEVVVPVTYTANGNDISTLLFKLLYDAAALDLDARDLDGDGVPDGVTVLAPRSHTTQIRHVLESGTGFLEVLIADMTVPLTGLPDGAVLEIRLRPRSAVSEVRAPVRFVTAPAPSFGSTDGRSVPGVSEDGSGAQAASRPTGPAGTGLATAETDAPPVAAEGVAPPTGSGPRVAGDEDRSAGPPPQDSAAPGVGAAPAVGAGQPSAGAGAGQTSLPDSSGQPPGAAMAGGPQDAAARTEGEPADGDPDAAAEEAAAARGLADAAVGEPAGEGAATAPAEAPARERGERLAGRTRSLAIVVLALAAVAAVAVWRRR